MGTTIRRLAYLAILGFPLCVLGTRFGLFDMGMAFNGIKYTVYLSLAILLLGLILGFVQRAKNPQQSRNAFIGAALSLIPLLGIGSQIIVANGVPSIHNISTDVKDPPQFDKISSIRSASDNPLQYDAAKLSSVQQQAYPRVATLALQTMTSSEAFARSLTTAKKLGWEVVNQDEAVGIIEATETSTLWGFKDDVVIRIRTQEDQVTIDLRSVSRVGQSDLGVNAKRINAFLDAFGR